MQNRPIEVAKEKIIRKIEISGEAKKREAETRADSKSAFLRHLERYQATAAKVRRQRPLTP